MVRASSKSLFIGYIKPVISEKRVLFSADLAKPKISSYFVSVPAFKLSSQ